MNNAILCLDIASCLAVVVFSKLTFKSLKHPIFLICAWWNVWLMISNIIKIGVGIQLGTHLVFLLFIYSIFGFGIIFHRNVRPAHFSIPRLLLRYRSAWLSGAIFIYLLTICLGVYAYRLQKIYTTDFRNLAFQTGDYSSLLYGSYYVQTLASLFLAPLVLFGCIALPVAGAFYKNFKYMLLGLLFSAAADTQTNGRSYLYIYTISLVLAAILLKRKYIFFSVILLTVAAAVLMTESSKRRLGADEVTPEMRDAAMNQFVDYHIFGFYLFDHDFSDGASKLHQGTSFGRLSLLSYPDTLACMILRRAGFFVTPEIDRLAIRWQDDNVVLGVDKDGQPIAANAFYTSLYPMFYDFGYLGVVLIPGLFVYFLVVDYKTYLRQPNFISLFVVIFLTIFFITSIFTSKTTSNDIQVVFYCILFRGIFLKESRAGVFKLRSSQGGIKAEK